MILRNAVFISLGGFLVVCLGLFFVPWGKTTLYRAVLEEESQEFVASFQLEGNPQQEYTVHEEKLYLRTNTVRPTPVGKITYESPTHWSMKTIQAFRKEHPELEKYWPDSTAPSGGVSWLEEDR